MESPRYDLELHGDSLEKKVFKFIRTYIPNYELVWSTFIGNKGNDTMADIDDYEFNDERLIFSECTYTVLESLYQMKRQIDKNVFDVDPGNDYDKVLDLKDQLLLFFTYVGRINDNVLRASQKIGINDKRIDEKLGAFYHQRHILVHGQILPFKINVEGKIEIPLLSVSSDDPKGWYFKKDRWADIVKYETEPVNETADKVFTELAACIDGIFGIFYSVIKENLKGRVLKFYRIDRSSTPVVKGTVDVYGFNRLKEGPNLSGTYGRSGTSGKFGSSGDPELYDHNNKK